MVTTFIIISSVVSYLIIGIALSFRYWRLINLADKAYSREISKLLLSMNSRKSDRPEYLKELTRLESEREDLRTLTKGRFSGFFTIALVYMSVWPLVILKGDDFYDTNQQS